MCNIHFSKKTRVSNWGNFPSVEASLFNFSNLNKLKAELSDLKYYIPRGLGRCYGDSSLSDNIISTLRFNKILEFKDKEGLLTCSSGVTFHELLEIFVPRGWFLPVTPGTKFITIGGAAASDVHGKGHHKSGSFSDHIVSMDVAMPNGGIVRCSREENQRLFRAVCGGMGLVGLILNVTFRLKRIETACIREKKIRARDIDEIMELMDKHSDYSYSVAWLDCLASGNDLGRSILMLGEWAAIDYINSLKGINGVGAKNNINRKINIPFFFPSHMLNRFTVSAFNYLYYNMSFLKDVSIVDYNTFFYPLDCIQNWNRIYGRSGFIQYQCVLPKDESKMGLNKILKRVSRSKLGSFLAILKLFGKGNNNLLSFPMEGYTLALDFPVSGRIFSLLSELDKIVMDHGGRLYLAKDARMSGETFRKGYNNFEEFLNIKFSKDAEGKLKSEQSERLGISSWHTY